MNSPVHGAAQKGYTLEAATYQRGRPEYPAELQGWLRDVLKIGPGSAVADVGAGTGKFSKLLLATGATVTAVEPVDEMRAQALKIDGLLVVNGTAQHIPLPDGSVDAITCAQAFHWFAQAEVLDEFARVLRPGGRLGLVWNVRDESHDFVARITELITPYEGDAPRFYKGDWRKPFPHRAFTPLRAGEFGHAHTGPPETVIIDRFMSVSFLAALDDAERDKVRAALRELIRTHPDLRGREVVHFPYSTMAFCCERLAA